MVVAEAAWGDTTAMDCDLDTLSTSLTWVNDLRMKYRLGKYCDSRLELVDAYDPELLDRVVDFLSVRRPSSSLDSDNDPIMCAGSSGELNGGSDELASGLMAARALAFCSFA